METSKYKDRLGKQYKSLSFYAKEIQYDSGSRTISGYAAIFNNIDKFGDMLLKGCFSKSIQERGPESSANDKIIMLWMHDMHEPIGRITLLQEDEKGLYFEASIDDVERGNQALKQLESGTLNQFSIGYSLSLIHISGDSGAATAGNYGAATARGKASTGSNGLSVARGNNVRVKGGIGSILVIAEEKEDTHDIVDWKAVLVDGEVVKADTWYRLENGELVEVD